ncbi:MAG: TetR/AcrR family transcriptional regulator [FCB group bacterium]|nr:TetR/AcrR family transcriptional regulator [FCB group bacterium]
MTISERRKREKEQRRKAIIDAAEKLFAQNGFHTTSLDRVAEAVEISKGTIYLYFDSKEDLFFSVLEDKFQSYIAGMKAKFSQASNLREAIEFLVDYELSHSKRHHHFFRLMLAEQTKFNPHSRNELRKKMIEKHVAHLETIECEFKRYMGDENRYPFTPKTLALCITGAINAHSMSWLISGMEKDIPRLRDEITGIFLNGAGGQRT